MGPNRGNFEVRQIFHVALIKNGLYVKEGFKKM